MRHERGAGTVPYTPGTGEVHVGLGLIWRITSANRNLINPPMAADACPAAAALLVSTAHYWRAAGYVVGGGCRIWGKGKKSRI